jgi:hypothetical protein
LKTGNLEFGRIYRSDEKAVDDRWDQPGILPVSNGPHSFTTPPEKPSFTLAEDGQTIEFTLPYPMHVVDIAEWPPIRFKLSDKTLTVSKPLPLQAIPQMQGLLGNELPAAHYSVLRVGCASRQSANFPSASDLWPFVERVCEWIRIKCRHYWLLTGQSGFAASLHASVLTQNGNVVSQKNVVSYGRNLVVKPLDCPIWQSIEHELMNNIALPVSESLYCDALVSAFGGNEIKAVLELGVAAEVEISDLLAAVANTLPSNSIKKKFLKQQPKFTPKLREWPQQLGLDKAEGFTLASLFPGWVDVLCELYRFRNSVAHSGTLQATGHPTKHLSQYIYATNALFAYTRAQRVK